MLGNPYIWKKLEYAIKINIIVSGKLLKFNKYQQSNNNKSRLTQYVMIADGKDFININQKQELETVKYLTTINYYGIVFYL